MARFSGITVIVGLVAALLFALMAVLFVAPGPESTQRLGLMFGVIGLAVTALVGMLRADQSAKQTNGSLDTRIEAGVHRALAARRKGDPDKAE